MRVTTLLAAIAAALAGSLVYLTLVYSSSSEPVAGMGELIGLVLLTLSCSLMFVTFALIPLWLWLHGALRFQRFTFLLAGCVAWFLVTGTLLATVSWDPSAGPTIAAQLLTPGIVLVVVFGLIAKTD